MKKKRAIWIYAGLIGCVLGFAGCSFIAGFLGMGPDEPGGADEPVDGGSPSVPKAESPVALPGPGSAYTTAQSVALSTGTVDAVIYYTVDGKDPTTDGTKYGETTVSVSPGATLKAVAVKDGLAASDIMAITYMDATVFGFNSGTINRYTGSAKDVMIPGAIDGTPVTAIGVGAFVDTPLENIFIPDSVTAIGDGAFYNNSLTSVTIPDSVTTIGNEAFTGSGAGQIMNIIIGNSVATIGASAFSNNSLADVTIPESVTEIGDAAFNHNPLTRVTMLPANVAITGVTAFAGDLKDAYSARGPGTYTRPSNDLDKQTVWTKQQ
jgi:hypothetical protein